jgi:hypothetical protein
MLRRVALVRTDFSEERIASTVRVTRIGEIGTALACMLQLQEPHGIRSQKTAFFEREMSLSGDDGSTVVIWLQEAHLHVPIRGRFSTCSHHVSGARGSVVVKTLCYKPEGRGFETRWGEWFLSIYLILLVALGPGVYSSSNKNEYQKQKK